MQRRQFLKLLGASCAAPIIAGWPRLAVASQGYSGPLLIFVHAFGGWDPLQFCDPKADHGRGYRADEIETAGNLRFAPMEWTHRDGGTFAYARDFFQSFHQQCVVINGINMQTNAHRAGMVNAFQGTFSESYPTLSAAHCAALSPDSLMGYVVTGEFSSTGGLIPYTALNSSKVLDSLANPNVSVAGIPNNIQPFRMPETVFDLVDVARAERLDRILARRDLLPRRRKTLEHFKSAMDGFEGLEKLGSVLPPDGFQERDERFFRNPIVKQADMALHVMAAGLAVSADMQTSARFDSHSDHEYRQGYAFADLVYGVRFLMKRAEEIDARTGSDLSNRLTIVVHSEFGRSPKLNANKGTDHWPTTSALVMRKDFATTGIGGRTVGYSTNDGSYRAGRINPINLQPDESGIELTSAHVHKSLRSLLGIATSPSLAGYGFPDVEDVSIFHPGAMTPQA